MDKKFLLTKINKNSALPAANQLARQLIWLIAEGTIKEGEQLPSIRNYAELLNIHYHTVRAAYHILEQKNLVRINPRIGTIVQKYIPFASIDQKEFPDTNFIAVLVPSLSDFYRQVIDGIESVAIESKQIPVILSCHEDPIYAERQYRNLSARGIKGFINISIGFPNEFYANFKQKENLNVPLVFLDVVESGTHSLTIDTASAIGLAVSHFLDHGYNDLAFINCPSEWPIGREALKGFRLALKKRGIEFSQTSVFSVPDFGYQAGQFVIEKMIQYNSLPRAIVTISDNLAFGAISELKQKGFQIPQDVAIIGYNDILPSSIIDPRLSSIALPLYEMGRQTMLSLNKVLKGNLKGWIRKSFSGQLVIRDSCGCEK